jgi:hypothetical protein
MSVAWRGSFPHVEVGSESLLDTPIQALDLAVATGAARGPVHLGGGFSLYLPLPDAVASVVHMDPDELYAPFLEDALDFLVFDFAAGVARGPVAISAGGVVGIDLTADTVIVARSVVGESVDGKIDLTESIDVDLDRRLGWTATPLVGVSWTHAPWSAYLSYRGEIGFETTGDTLLEFELEDSILSDFLDDFETPVEYLSAWSPARLASGVAWDQGRVRPEIAVRWLDTSSWRDTQGRSPDPEFHDVFELAAAVEGTLAPNLVARFGLGLQPSPVPDQGGDSRLADSDRRVLGLGLGWALPDHPRDGDHTELVLAAQRQSLASRKVGDSGTLSGGIWMTSLGLVTRL